MGSRSFYLYPRGKHRIWYVKFRNPETGIISDYGKSTGTTEKERAEYIARKWYFEGIPTGRSRRIKDPFLSFGFETIMDRLKATVVGLEEAERLIGFLKSRGLVKDAKIKEEGPSLTHTYGPTLTPSIVDYRKMG